jgi:hypothetical protein
MVSEVEVILTERILDPVRNFNHGKTVEIISHAVVHVGSEYWITGKSGCCWSPWVVDTAGQ